MSVAISQSLHAPSQVFPTLHMTTPGLLPRNQTLDPSAPTLTLYTTSYSLLPQNQTLNQSTTSSFASSASSMQTNPMKTPVMQMVTLKADETPAFIVNSRKHLIVSCRKNCKNMSDIDKRKHAKVIDGLSRPYNNTLINVLKSVEEEPPQIKPRNCLALREILRECTSTSKMGVTSLAYFIN
jgi:hypothetical protein